MINRKALALISFFGGVIATLASLVGFLEWIDRGVASIGVEQVAVDRGCSGSLYKGKCNQKEGEATVTLYNKSDHVAEGLNIEIIYIDEKEKTVKEKHGEIYINAREDWRNIDFTATIFPSKIFVCLDYPAGYPGSREFKKYKIDRETSRGRGSYSIFRGGLIKRDRFFFNKPDCI